MTFETIFNLNMTSSHPTAHMLGMVGISLMASLFIYFRKFSYAASSGLLLLTAMRLKKRIYFQFAFVLEQHSMHLIFI